MKLLIQTFIAVLVSCAVVFSAQAGIRDVGNPGKGVYVGDRLVLLDLFEMGLSNPKIDEFQEPLAIYLTKARSLSLLTTAEARLLAIKLTELRAVSPKLADSIAIALNLYIWRALASELVDIPEDSPVKLPGESIILANRMGAVIRVSQPTWERLDSVNRVALVMHEMMMALAPHFLEDMTTSAFRVRQIVGYLFMPDFKARGIVGFRVFSGIQPQLSVILEGDTLNVVTNIFARVEPSLHAAMIVGPYVSEVSVGDLCATLGRELKTDWTGMSTLSMRYSSQEIGFKIDVQQTEQASRHVLAVDHLRSTPESTNALGVLTFNRKSIKNCYSLVNAKIKSVSDIFQY